MKQLLEKSRNELVSKSKSDPKGLQRYKKRVNSHVASSVKQYNRIDMNTFFKNDIITINIEVRGETDNYIVSLSFGGVLDTLKKDLQRQNKEIELRDIVKAIVSTFNKGDVYVKCTCPDFKYRFGYWSTVNKYKDGEAELRPSNITNPNDNLGSACKHTLLVLANTSWVIKVASVIKNYIEYMKLHREQQFAKIIYPAIYGKAYEKEVQQNLFGDELETSEQDINQSNIEARQKGQFKPGNPYRFTKSPTEKNQLSIDDIEGENNGNR